MRFDSYAKIRIRFSVVLKRELMYEIVFGCAFAIRSSIHQTTVA